MPGIFGLGAKPGLLLGNYLRTPLWSIHGLGLASVFVLLLHFHIGSRPWVRFLIIFVRSGSAGTPMSMFLFRLQRGIFLLR